MGAIRVHALARAHEALSRPALERELKALNGAIEAGEKQLEAITRSYHVKNVEALRLRGDLSAKDPIYGAFASGRKLTPAARAKLRSALESLQGEIKTDRAEIERLEKSINNNLRRYHIVHADLTRIP